MWALLGSLFFITGSIYLWREITFIRIENDLLIISYMRLMYAFTYGFIPSMLCFIYAISNIQVSLVYIIVDYSDDGLFCLYLLWFFSLIGYCGLNIGYRYNIKIKTSKIKSRRKAFQLTELQTIFIAFSILIIGFVSLYLWTKTAGSISEFILKANWYRGDYTNSLHNNYAMFRQPANLVTISALIFFCCILNHDKKYRVICFLGYILAMFSSVLFLLCSDGRLQIAMFFGIQIIGFVLYRNDNKFNFGKKQVFVIAMIAFAGLLFISKLDIITGYIRFGEIIETTHSDDSLFAYIMNEFGFVYESVQMSIKTNLFNDGKMMLIDDVVRGIFAFLPSRFTPDGFEQIWRYNTYLCTGSHTTGTIPCDMLSQSIYDLKIIGVLFVPMFWGQIVRKVEEAFKEGKEVPFNRALYLGLAMLFFRLINYCGLADFSRGIFSYLVTMIIAILITIFARTKNKRNY